MLGNLGYSSVNCQIIPVEVGAIHVSCNYGVIGNVTQIGVTNTGDSNPVDICVVNSNNQACAPNNSDFLNKV